MGRLYGLGQKSRTAMEGIYSIWCFSLPTLANFHKICVMQLCSTPIEYTIREVDTRCASLLRDRVRHREGN